MNSVWLGILFCLGGPALLGTEAFGNRPVPAQPGWAPGIQEMANDEHRVYTRWVNGNEDFVFRGGLDPAKAVDAVNAALASFVDVKNAEKEVILLSGKGQTRSFKSKLVTYDWKLHVPSGLYLGRAMGEKGTKVMARHPQLTIHCSAVLPVERLSIPEGLQVIGVEDLVQRYEAGLKNTAASIRYTALSGLGEFAYIDGTLALVRSGLEDESGIVRRVAAHTLARAFGVRAQTVLPMLERLRGSAEGRQRDAYDRAIQAIRAAKPTGPTRSPVQAGRIARIRAVIDSRASRPAKPGTGGNLD